MGENLGKSLGVAFRATVIAIAFAAYAWMFYSMGTSSATYQEQAKRNTQQEIAASDEQMESECAGLGGAALRECLSKVIQGTREAEHDEYDLEAQRSASEWAFWAAIVAVGQLIATIAGLIYIKGTLEATHKAIEQGKADSAEQAGKMQQTVDEAKRSADAMEGVATSMAVNAGEIVKSVAISKDVARQQRLFGRMQMRAYLSVLIGHALYQDGRTLFEAQPVVSNTGHTPARNVRWRIEAAILSAPLPPDFRFPLGPKREGGSIVAPQQSVTMPITVAERVDDSEIAAVKAGAGKALYTWGYLAYEDIFGETHRCTFAQKLHWMQLAELTEEGRIPERVHGFYLEKHNKAN